jgi:oxygen-independent coproporphyrinogen III oxidase
MFWNEAKIPVWREAVLAGRLPVAHAQMGSPREAHRRQAVQQLWCRLELTVESVSGGLEEAYERLAGHALSGLVQVLDDRIVVTDAGRHALPMLCRELDEPTSANDATHARCRA